MLTDTGQSTAHNASSTHRRTTRTPRALARAPGRAPLIASGQDNREGQTRRHHGPVAAAAGRSNTNPLPQRRPGGDPRFTITCTRDDPRSTARPHDDHSAAAIIHRSPSRVLDRRRGENQNPTAVASLQGTRKKEYRKFPRSCAVPSGSASTEQRHTGLRVEIQATASPLRERCPTLLRPTESRRTEAPFSRDSRGTDFFAAWLGRLG